MHDLNDVYPILYPDYAVASDTLHYLNKPCQPLSADLVCLLNLADGHHSAHEIQTLLEGRLDVKSVLTVLETFGYTYLQYNQPTPSTSHEAVIWVLSPHMDDAFLSIGGSILSWVGTNGVCIQDIFGNDPWIIDRRLSLSDYEKIDCRKREEAFNAERAGCLINIWDFPSRSQRGYQAWNAPVDLERDHNLQAKLEEHIVAELHANCCTTVLIPLAVGCNTDHQLVHDLGVSLTQQGIFQAAGIQRIGFYEDLPYACDTQNWRRSSDTLLSLLPLTRCEFFEISPVIQEKWQLVRTYRSQLGPSAPYQILQYAQRAGMYTSLRDIDRLMAQAPGEHHERIWWFQG